MAEKKQVSFIGLLSGKAQRKQVPLSPSIEDPKERLRREEIAKKKTERRMKLRDDNYLKENRERMMQNVCQIIYAHIQAAEKFIKKPTNGALLFDEGNYGRK